MKKSLGLVLSLLMTCMLASCSFGALNADVSTVRLNKDGSIEQLTVEQMAADEDALRSFVEDEVAAYSGTGEVELVSLETTEDGMTKLLLKFSDASCYEAFEGDVCFVGTVSEALAAGYEVPEEMSADTNAKIAIVSEGYSVMLPGKILQSSGGTIGENNKTVTVSTDEESPIYMIYE